MQKKHQYRLVAMILAAVFVFEAMPLGAMATGGSGGVDLAAAYENGELAAPTVIGEVEELRTERGREAVPNEVTAAIWQCRMVCRFTIKTKTANGRDIDNTLQPVSTYSEAGTYSAVNGESAVSFAADLANGQLFATSYGAHSVSPVLGAPGDRVGGGGGNDRACSARGGRCRRSRRNGGAGNHARYGRGYGRGTGWQHRCRRDGTRESPAEMLAVSTTPYNTAVQAQLVALGPGAGYAGGAREHMGSDSAGYAEFRKFCMKTFFPEWTCCTTSAAITSKKASL